MQSFKQCQQRETNDETLNPTNKLTQCVLLTIYWSVRVHR